MRTSFPPFQTCGDRILVGSLGRTRAGTESRTRNTWYRNQWPPPVDSRASTQPYELLHTKKIYASFNNTQLKIEEPGCCVACNLSKQYVDQDLGCKGGRIDIV